MREAVAQLAGLVREWVEAEQSHVPEVDWGRMRQLEFQDVLRKRDTLVQTLPYNPCLQCEDFEVHVRSSDHFPRSSGITRLFFDNH